MFLSKDQKKELRRKGVFYYSPITYLLIKLSVLVILVTTITSSLVSFSKNIINTELKDTQNLSEIFNIFFVSSIVFLLAAIFFALLFSKFYLVSFKFKPKFQLPFNFINGFKGIFSSLSSILFVIIKLCISIPIIIGICWVVRFTDFSDNLFNYIFNWYNTSYWQLIVICCSICIISFAFSYVYFNFKHYMKLKNGDV